MYLVCVLPLKRNINSERPLFCKEGDTPFCCFSPVFKCHRVLSFFRPFYTVWVFQSTSRPVPFLHSLAFCIQLPLQIQILPAQLVKPDCHVGHVRHQCLRFLPNLPPPLPDSPVSYATVSLFKIMDSLERRLTRLCAANLILALVVGGLAFFAVLGVVVG